ncbi:putative multidrug resistance protein EmrK [Aquimixticola soesokkakensis]|uniref:Putative multidrug resistance protein EmrK n=1 Tax=Aquimixticola soesokkakensis TaxID=1519096 RepID=A0A1Y5SRS3_9RHOB|nr:HlyD family secretion protein [Aquimixticola soesokkakensis]SLN43730.1 putative multidrug resistance protein EmrK [Aquimixticola soesokkakensis]
MSQPQRISPVPPEQDTAVPPAQKPKSRKKAILMGVALVVLAGIGFEGYKWWTDGRFMVETDDAYVTADIAIVSSRILGYVASVDVDANDHVTKGQVIATLDNGDYQIALETAQSQFDSAGDTLARIDAQVQAAQAAVEQAEAARDAAQTTLDNATTARDRASSLAKSKIASQATLDDANATFATANANFVSAKSAVTSANAQVAVIKAERAEEVSAQHELKLAVDQAQRNLNYTELRAPFDGIISNLALEEGDLVSAGTRLAAVVPDHGLYIEANFKETQMEGVLAGSKVHVTLDALPDHEFEGEVASTAPATGSVFSLLPADNATGNFTKIVQRVPVRISLPDSVVQTGQLRAGLSAIVTVDSRTAPADATTVTAQETTAAAPADTLAE